LPASYELFGDYVLMCHPVPGFGGSLPRMCVENEKVLVNGLLKEFNIILKWNLDTDPNSESLTSLQIIYSRRRSTIPTLLSLAAAMVNGCTRLYVITACG